MKERYVIDGANVIYDSQRLPQSYESRSGAEIARPTLSYGQRLAAYCEIRRTAAGLLAEKESGQYDKRSV